MKKILNLKEGLVKNSFWSFVNSIVKQIGSLILAIILARFLMPKGYGLYSIAISMLMIFFTFTDLGINGSLVRYLSSALKEDKRKIPAYHRYLLKLKFFLTITASLLFILLSYPLAFYVFKNPQLLLPFLIASFYLFVFSFDSFYTQVFYSIEKVQYISFKESLSHILKIILVLFIFSFIASSYHIIGVFLSFILISIFMTLFSLFYIKKLLPEFYTKPEIKINKKRVRRFVKFLTIASISAIFFSGIDLVMLGIFVLPEYVGYYKAAFSLVFGIIGILNFPNLILLPVFTKLKNKQTKEVLIEVFRYISIITIPAIFGLLIFGRFFIKLFYRTPYLPATLPLYFLSFLIFPVISIGLFLSLFFAKEKPEIFAKLIFFISLINIILNLILINLFLLISSDWAMAGVAIATLMSWTIYFIFSVYIIKKEFKFSISFKPIIKPLIASLIMSGILFYILKSIKNMNLFFGIETILLGGLIYFLIMILIKGIEKKDFELIKILFRRRKN